MLCLVIGAYCEAIGIVLRLVFRSYPHSSGVYIVLYLFVVLSVSQSTSHRDKDADKPQPCAFLAGDYILLGRLVSHLNAPEYLRPFKPKAISTIFVISDGQYLLFVPIQLLAVKVDVQVTS